MSAFGLCREQERGTHRVNHLETRTAASSLRVKNRQCLILAGGFMDIIEALQQEESKLQRQLAAVQGAVAALNGGGETAISPGHTSPNGTNGKRTMSAAVRAKIARAARARWAKIRAAKAKKAK
jgi:hypothetical protein